MDAHCQKIIEQEQKFNAELPELLKQYPGKWALYLDGVQGIYDNEDTARRAAIKRYGLNDVTYLIAPIEERRPIPAWKLGGMGAAAVYEQILAKLQAKHDSLAAENTRLRSAINYGPEFWDNQTDNKAMIDSYTQKIIDLQAKHDALAAEITRLRAIVDAAIANLDARRSIDAAPRLTRECDTGKIAFSLPFDHPLWKVVIDTRDRMDDLIDALKER
jgi:hypothetical protein